jgi:DNA-binding transcriptional regulator YhcF (GntR family)
MLKLWLAREHGISIREQLSAQLLLGIASRRLAPGERLPSVRGLARHLGVHANTVSAVYRDLEALGWVTTRQGSGVFVNEVAHAQRNQGIEGFVRSCIEEAASRGFTTDAFALALQKITRESGANKLLVVHPDKSLARVLAREVEEALGAPVSSADFEQARQFLTPDSCVLVLPAHSRQASQYLKPACCRPIGLKSMEEMLTGYQRPPATALIAVVSRSESILKWATTLLSALGFSSAAVLQRNPDKPQWRRGLAACNIVATDVESICDLPRGIEPILFRIVSDSFLAQLRELYSATPLSQYPEATASVPIKTPFRKVFKQSG